MALTQSGCSRRAGDTPSSSMRRRSSTWAAKQGNRVVQVVGPIFRPEQYGIAVAEGGALRKPSNAALLELYDDGTYEKIDASWFSQSQ